MSKLILLILALTCASVNTQAASFKQIDINLVNQIPTSYPIYYTYPTFHGTDFPNMLNFSFTQTHITATVNTMMHLNGQWKGWIEESVPGVCTFKVPVVVDEDNKTFYDVGAPSVESQNEKYYYCYIRVLNNPTLLEFNIVKEDQTNGKK